jgi:hypothetical protein
MGAATGILSRPLLRSRKLRVDIGWKQVFMLTGTSNRLDVSRIIPRHEYFISGFAKNLVPGFAMLIEVRGQFRRKLETPFPETADQCFWHGPVKQAIRLGRAVPSRSQITDFVTRIASSAGAHTPGHCA